MPSFITPLSLALFKSDLVASRVSLFIGELAWAIMLWWPGDTFTRPTYNGMSAFMPETPWAVVFTVSAFCQISIVIRRNFTSVFGYCFAAFNAFLWVFCVWSMLHSVYPPPAAIGGEFALMCAALWISLRPGINWWLGKRYARQQRK